MNTTPTKANTMATSWRRRRGGEAAISQISTIAAESRAEREIEIGMPMAITPTMSTWMVLCSRSWNMRLMACTRTIAAMVPNSRAWVAVPATRSKAPRDAYVISSELTRERRDLLEVEDEVDAREELQQGDRRRDGRHAGQPLEDVPDVVDRPQRVGGQQQHAEAGGVDQHEVVGAGRLVGRQVVHVGPQVRGQHHADVDGHRQVDRLAAGGEGAVGQQLVDDPQRQAQQAGEGGGGAEGAERTDDQRRRDEDQEEDVDRDEHPALVGPHRRPSSRPAEIAVAEVEPVATRVDDRGHRLSRSGPWPLRRREPAPRTPASRGAARSCTG